MVIVVAAPGGLLKDPDSLNEVLNEISFAALEFVSRWIPQGFGATVDPHAALRQKAPPVKANRICQRNNAAEPPI